MIWIVSERQHIQKLRAKMSIKTYLSMLPNISEMEVSVPFSILTILDMIYGFFCQEFLEKRNFSRGWTSSLIGVSLLITVNGRKKCYYMRISGIRFFYPMKMLEEM